MSLIKLLPSEESSGKINCHLGEIGLPPKTNLHTTIIYTEETPIFMTENLETASSDLLPITIDPRTYSFQIFEGHLVLRYENALVNSLYRRFLHEAVRQCIRGYSDAPSDKVVESLQHHLSKRRSSPLYDFSPHITLSKDYKGRATCLQLPEFPIVFDRTILETIPD